MANQNPSNNLSQEDRSKGGKNSPQNFKNDPGRASQESSKSRSSSETSDKSI